STTHLLDESMVPLVGTPHPMTHIPVEGFFTFVERLPNQELPAISEENEGQSLRRQRKHACSSVRSHTRNGATEMPQEPDDIAPGSASRTNPEVIPELNYSPYAEVPPGPVHRRATSDNVVVEAARRNELRRAQEVEEIDLIGRDENVLMRPQKPVVRTGSNISNRCQSQVFLPELGLNDASTSVPVLDRNLSNSDPSINDEKPTKELDGPPPVILSRKVSSNHHDPWKNEFSCPTSTHSTAIQMRNDAIEIASLLPSVTRTENDDVRTSPPSSTVASFSRGMSFMRRSLRRLAGDSWHGSSHSPDFPTMFLSLDAATNSKIEHVQSSAECRCIASDSTNDTNIRRVATVPCRQRTTAHLKPRTGDRIEKKKTKTGSDTFSFGSLFGTNKGGRSKKAMCIDRSLETVLSSFQSKAGSGVAISLPT
ncbi:hypothetical protein Angca_000913, partial [Angiostrongylus cantonensis]